MYGKYIIYDGFVNSDVEFEFDMIQTNSWCLKHTKLNSKFIYSFLDKYHFGQWAFNSAGLLFVFRLYPDFLLDPPESKQIPSLNSRNQNSKLEFKISQMALLTARFKSVL